MKTLSVLKKSSLFLLPVCLFLLVAASDCSGQNNGKLIKESDSIKTHLGFKKLPDLNLTTLDGEKVGTSDIKNGHKLLFIFFSTECSHCTYQTELLTSGIKKLADKNIEVYMVTPFGKHETDSFYTVHNLSKISHIHVWLDTWHEFDYKFNPGSFPMLYFFDEKHHLEAVRIGVRTISEIIDVFGK